MSTGTNTDTETELLLGYLQTAREALLWKLDGLSEYDARRPLTPTGSNLLGIVKHVASVEHGYLTECFGREPKYAFPWLADDAPDNADMWATVDESSEQILEMCRGIWLADDTSVRELGLEAQGTVPWWGDRGDSVTMRHLLVHMIAETNRHAGQADILREQLDGSVGMRQAVPNMPRQNEEWWQDYVVTLEATARQAAGMPKVPPHDTIRI
ncbi:DinB family protein [Leucobacter coleopterorum]|uniref:DinB family protein n=1 Tax=Leucobacter coleopterorum TaxID=2714933 RepID=A0ABX6K1N5_9MICO|nr:DinB family protein [Leucobacter coleopterorum]QIM19099.1 DinB family protein [Leucobacter coleopterorum]